jgi:hypothetical protein
MCLSIAALLSQDQGAGGMSRPRAWQRSGRRSDLLRRLRAGWLAASLALMKGQADERGLGAQLFAPKQTSAS